MSVEPATGTSLTESTFFKKSRGALEALGYFLALVLVWEGAISFFEVPGFLFPAPSAIAAALWQGLVSGIYLYHLAVTMVEILAGFALGSLAGLLLGIGMVTIPVLDRVLYPYVVAIQTVPKVAIAPLMIVWFGFGIQSKILMVAMACMFPVLINTVAGLRATDSDRLALVRAMCGTNQQVLRFVQLPSALPYIFAGLNTAIVLAVIGAIVGEFVGARLGIGVLILQANFSLDLASVFALLVLLSSMGIILNLAMKAIEKRVCFWSGRSSK
ncbi:ABC transporter permease [Roseiarcaceae bacterium H3SJ34-1]|uniref:ABC transporter permease n=1 Tax=Terripilifer ovatus TaxID=3032367 RepID=UPI003AB9B65C|nr:ABC transporter permease [Roseiarcaceae bacterium H3SJ34-1]